MTWPERCASDASLRAFVDAEIGRARVELQALRVDHTHQAEIIASQKHRIAELERDLDKKRSRR